MSSLVLMGLANLSAGLVLMSKATVAEEALVQPVAVAGEGGLGEVWSENITVVFAEENGVSGNETYFIKLVPVMSCIFITFGYACGLGPVPWILFGELLPGDLMHELIS